MTAVHFIHNFREALFSYIGSIALWFLLLVALCYTGELFHRFIQMANVRLGTIGMYLTLLMVAAIISLIDNNRLLHLVLSSITGHGNH